MQSLLTESVGWLKTFYLRFNVLLDNAGASSSLDFSIVGVFLQVNLCRLFKVAPCGCTNAVSCSPYPDF